jgi:hypothetical protein
MALALELSASSTEQYTLVNLFSVMSQHGKIVPSVSGGLTSLDEITPSFDLSAFDKEAFSICDKLCEMMIEYHAPVLIGPYSESNATKANDHGYVVIMERSQKGTSTFFTKMAENMMMPADGIEELRGRVEQVSLDRGRQLVTLEDVRDVLVIISEQAGANHEFVNFAVQSLNDITPHSETTGSGEDSVEASESATSTNDEQLEEESNNDGENTTIH